MKTRITYILMALLCALLFFSPRDSYSLPTETEYPGTLVYQGYYDDNSWGPYNIGFNFSFFCNNYTQFYVTSNGLVMFGGGSSAYSNYDIPTSSSPNNYIAAFWDDIVINSTGTIHYTTVGTAPNRKCIIQFTNMSFYASPVLLGTFQVILYETSNNIQVQYRSIVDLTNLRASGNSATIGLENSTGTAGVKYSYNESGKVYSELAILYTPSGCSYTYTSPALYDGVLLVESPARASIPRLLSPAYNSTIGNVVNFQWEAAANASSYNVIISTNADLSSPLHTSANLTTLTYEYTLSLNQTYYWAVHAKNSNGVVTWSEIWKFSTSSAPPLVAVPQTMYLEQNDQRTATLMFTGGDAGSKTATITQLPAQGGLFQFDNSPITTVPTNVTDISFRVIYKATEGTGNGAGNFNFQFSDATGTSAIATYTVNVSPPGIPNFLYAAKETDRVEITFDRPMADPTGKHLEFAVQDNGVNVTPLSCSLKAGDPSTIVVYTTVPLNIANTIRVAYTKGTVLAQSGGILETFSFQLAGKIAQIINFGALADKTYGDPSFTVSATASSGLPVTFTSSNSTVASVSGSTVTVNNAGSCLINAFNAGNATYQSVIYQRTQNVLKKAATITITNTSQPYTGSGIAVTTTTNPAGLTVKVQYNNSITLPVNPGTYNVDVVIDEANYEGTAAATLTIIDNTNPTITVQSNTSTTVAAGTCSKSLATDNPVTSDNVGVTKLTWALTGATVATSPATGINNLGTYTFNLGVTTVTYTVYDAAGNTATASFTVTVTDNINPTISVQANASTTVAAGTCSKSLATTNPTTADNCSVTKLTWALTGATVATSPATGINNLGTYTFNLGVTTVTYTVYDAAGNTAVASFTVTVTDNINPTISVQANASTTVAAGTCSKSLATTNPTTADNCSVTKLTWALTGATVATSPATGINNLGTYTFNLGITTVTYTVYDAAGNTAVASFTVTVTDNINPTISVQANASTTVAAGTCSKSLATTNPTTADNCSVTKLTWALTGATVATSPATGINNLGTYTFNLGVTTVTYTVYDAAGNTATASFTVTVTDNINPTISVQANASTTVAAGTCSKSLATTNPTTADNCSVDKLTWALTGATVATSPATGINNLGTYTFNLGVTTVTYTVYDAAGNTATASFTVTVNDNINPTITAPATVNVVADMGSCVATGVALGTPVTADNCSVASTVNDAPASFPLGSTTVTWTVTDGSGNIATATQLVIVSDDQNPTITAPATVNAVADNGSCVATGVALGTPVTADNCSVASTVNDAPASFPLGSTTVTWTVTDGSGNIATATQLVIVSDDQNPTITAPATVNVVADNGSCVATGVALGTPVTADNCSVASTVNDAPAFFPLGSTTVTWTVTDGSGNIATATQTVVVTDNQNPTITAPANVNAVADMGSCVATGVALGTPVTADNCSVASTVNDAPAFFPLGSTTVTWTVSDGSGNIATATQLVVVSDDQNPTITAPATVNVVADMGSCVATGVALGTPVTADNCSVASTVNDATAFFPVGSTTVTWTVTDGSGNIATATQLVIVSDDQNPTITAPATVNVVADMGSCVATGVALGAPVTADNCSVASTVNDAPASFPLGSTTVTWTVTDGSGNIATATQIVVVTDTQNPVAMAQDITINLDANGVATITPAMIDNGSYDNCSVSLSADITTFDCSNVGSNSVVLTVSDASGNISTASAIVTVADITAPNALAQSIVLALDANGQAAITASDIDNGSSDACGVASMTLDVTDFNCANVGANNVTLTVVDVNGNSSTASAIVTVTDNLTPLAAAQDIIVYLDATGNAIVDAMQINNSSSDNCGIAGYAIDVTSVNCSNIGMAVPVVLTVTDNAGNISTANAEITVLDTLAPVLTNPGNQIVPSAAGCLGTLADYTSLSSATDNCSTGMLISQSLAPGTSFAGSQQVILTSSDDNGNTGYVSFMVYSEDSENPVAIAQDITVYLDGNGVADINPADLDNGSYDNCALATYEADVTSFNCQHVGVPQNVTLTVYDGNGNSSSAISVVTVIDTISPVVVAQNITIALDANNEATISVMDIDNGSSDNCGIDTMYLDVYQFTCANLGVNSVVLTVVDNNGNLSTVEAEVTLLDTIAPVALSQNIAVYLDANGEVAIQAADVDGGSYDNCSIASLLLDNTVFTCNHIGLNQVILTVTDAGGNIANTTAEVTVADTLNPIVICVADTLIEVDENIGFYEVTGNMFDVFASDNCQISVTNNINGSSSLDGSILTEGVHVIEWTVTDIMGNASTCSMSITIDLITSVVTAESIAIAVWPNPAQTFVNVRVPDSDTYDVSIYDMSGKQLFANGYSEQDARIDVESFAKGIYVLKVKSGSHICNFRLTLE